MLIDTFHVFYGISAIAFTVNHLFMSKLGLDFHLFYGLFSRDITSVVFIHDDKIRLIISFDLTHIYVFFTS